MHKITIIRSYLPKKPVFLYELRESMSGQITTQACYMGQLLLGKSITPLYQKKPIKLVSEMGIAIYPFTRQARGKMVQSDLCTTIMNLPPSQESERKLAELLAPFNFEITFQDTPNATVLNVWTSSFKQPLCDFCGEPLNICTCKEIDGEIVCQN